MNKPNFYQQPTIELLMVQVQCVIAVSPEPGSPGGDEPYNPGGDY